MFETYDDVRRLQKKNPAKEQKLHLRNGERLFGIGSDKILLLSSYSSIIMSVNVDLTSVNVLIFSVTVSFSFSIVSAFTLAIMS